MLRRFDSRRLRIAALGLLLAATIAAFVVALAKQLAAADDPLAGARVAFIGDSYTAGTGASSPDEGFAAVLTAAEGWQSRNFARGSTGYATSTTGSTAKQGCGLDRCPDYSGVIAQAAAYRPTVVLVSGGRNDAVVPADTERSAIRSFYTQLRRSLPDASIVAVSPVWDSTTPPASLTTMATDVRSAVQAVGGRYLDIGQPLRGQRDLISSDGVHPNSAGHARIAIAVEQALDRT